MATVRNRHSDYSRHFDILYRDLSPAWRPPHDVKESNAALIDRSEASLRHSRQRTNTGTWHRRSGR